MTSFDAKWNFIQQFRGDMRASRTGVRPNDMTPLVLLVVFQIRNASIPCLRRSSTLPQLIHTRYLVHTMAPTESAMLNALGRFTLVLGN